MWVLAENTSQGRCVMLAMLTFSSMHASAEFEGFSCILARPAVCAELSFGCWRLDVWMLPAVAKLMMRMFV